jgi:hypothetical protein
MIPAGRSSSSLMDDLISFSHMYVVCFPTICTSQVHTFMCSYRKSFIWKTVAMTDVRVFEVASRMKMHVVCHACYRRSVDVDNSDCYQEWLSILLIISAAIWQCTETSWRWRKQMTYFAVWSEVVWQSVELCGVWIAGKVFDHGLTRLKE